MLKVPSLQELESTPFYFGQKPVTFLPKQWELTFAQEPEIAFVGGYGASKTFGGICRATRLSTWYPGNKGVIGRYASTDLAATTQADCLEFWQEANLLHDFVEKGKYKIPTALLRCVDPFTQEILPNKYAEVLFTHLDDPTHTHGHHLGWGWIDEANECIKKAYDKLLSRMRRPGFNGLYSLWVTSNTDQGYDWIYEHFFDPEALAKLKVKKPEAFKARRSIHSTTYDNARNLPDSYIPNMENSYSEKMVKVYLGGSYENFDGQIYEEFTRQLHVISEDVFKEGVPKRWNRLLAVDVGGSDPWAWIWAAVDEAGNVIVYDEIYMPGTRVAPFAAKAKPRIDGLKFQAKIIDNENKIAAGELAEHGIHFTNAKKQNKNDSIMRLSGYLHPNELHAFPSWHPDHGKLGSPRLFITDNCKNLIVELPQQRWRKIRGLDTLQNEPDPNVPNHAVDALLYCVRELPKPTVLERGIIGDLPEQMSKMGKIINLARREAKEQKKRDLWNIHMGSGRIRSHRRMIGVPS